MDTVFQTALLVPNIKPLLLREFRNGYYALLPMQLALYAVNALAQNLNIAFLAVPVYTMVGLQPNVWSFLTFLGALSCLVWLESTYTLDISGCTGMKAATVPIAGLK